MRNGGSQVHWSALIDTAHPQIIFAQETKDPASFQFGARAGPDLSEVLWSPVEHGKWGSALFAPEATTTPIILDQLRGWVVGGHVQLAELEFFAFSVHLPPTSSSYIRTAHLLLDLIASVSRGESLVLAGDWNLTVSPRADCDPLNSSRSESELIDRLATEFELVPAWSTCNPQQPLPQTLRWAREPTHPYHCDGIFVPNAWREKLVAAHVLQGPEWSTISDHSPVIAVLDASVMVVPQSPA